MMLRRFRLAFCGPSLQRGGGEGPESLSSEGLSLAFASGTIRSPSSARRKKKKKGLLWWDVAFCLFCAFLTVMSPYTLVMASMSPLKKPGK